MAQVSEPWVHGELQALLGQLSAQQARGVVRIVRAELEGRSISSLLTGRDKICTSTTYYGSGTTHSGWLQKPAFVEALKQARSAYRTWLMENGTADALTILAEASPKAGQELRRQVTGDLEAVEALSRKLAVAVRERNVALVIVLAESLGATGLSAARPALVGALEADWSWASSGDDLRVYGAVAQALARIARALDPDRQKAATGVLDRADLKTAAKGTVKDEGEQVIKFDLSGVPAHLLGSITDTAIGG
jgi:hypothetical protein